MIDLLVEGLRPEPHEQPYWDALRAHRLVLQRCRACGRLQHYPRSICAQCLSADLEFVPSSGHGVVFSYTVIHRAPIPELRPLAPYALALIDLDDGVRMVANLAGDSSAVRIGALVHITFVDVTPDVTLPVFALS